MDYVADNIVIRWAVCDGYAPTDYIKLFSNDGDSIVVSAVSDVTAIDFSDAAHDGREIELFPSNTGYFGFGHTTFGDHAFGHGESRDTIGYGGEIGFGHYPFGHAVFGHSPTYLEMYVRISEVGNWKLGFEAYDRIGNSDAGTAEQDLLFVDLEPKEPDRFQSAAYSLATSTVTLTV